MKNLIEKQEAELKTESSKYAYSLAVDLIDVYVERGETIKDLKSGQMGRSDNEGFRSIGGICNDKLYNTDHIVVILKDKKEFVFKLKDIFDNLKQ